MKNLTLLIVILLFFFSCKKESDDYAAEAVALDEPAAITTPEPASKSKPSNDMDSKVDSGNKIEQKIIKNASLVFETDNLETTYENIITQTKNLKGLIQSDTESNYDGRIGKQLLVRLPSDKFETYLAGVSKGVNYFDRKEISSEDVTSQYIDISARLKTKKELENRYLELLKKASKISEMIEIEQKLSEIREEVEAKQGELNYLQSQVAMSTFRIEFYKIQVKEKGIGISYFAKIGNAIISGFYSIGGFILFLFEYWPFVIILVILFLYLRKKRKFYRKHLKP